MHSPFDLQSNDYQFSLPEDVPLLLKKYVNCVHYTDSCLGAFLNEYNKISLEQLDLIITSDHTVFKDELLNDFKDVNRKLGWAIPEDMSYCPLIINSPKIKENRSYDISAYQMDIYPTIQSLIGDTTYVWKGLGENLLDSTYIDNRKTDESNLYQLSNRIIHNNTLSRYIE